MTCNGGTSVCARARGDGPAGDSGGALVVVGTSATEATTLAGAALTQFLTVSWNR